MCPPSSTRGAGWLQARHAHPVAGLRALGGGETRVQFSSAGSGRGPEPAGAAGSRTVVGGEQDAGAGSAPPTPPPAECGCGRPQLRTGEPRAQRPGHASSKEPPRR